MKKDFFALNDSKYLMNNSSMHTAENSSFQSKMNSRKNRINSHDDYKYSNTVIFQLPRREKKNIYKKYIKNKTSLYLTDIMNTTNTTYKGKEINLKNTFGLTSIGDINKKMITNKISKEILPNIDSHYKSYNKYVKNPKCFTCCDTKLNPKYLIRLYNEQHMNNFEDIINNKKAKINTVRDNKNTYIRKINDIKRIKYEINLKKEAINEYKENLKNHINSINHTTYTIKSYKESLETSFLNKYNEILRIINGAFREEKKKSDQQSEELLNLEKEVSTLQSLISKKEATLIKIKKWISLQIYIKEGKKPKNINEILEKRYKNKLIFETPEELEIIFKHKENKNLRLMDEYNKRIEDNKAYMNELTDLERHIGNIELDFDNIIMERENTLENLKSKSKDLNNSLNELNALKQKYYELHNSSILNKRSKSVNNKLTNINSLNKNKEGEIKKNELGIYYKFTNIHNNIFVLIDVIYSAFIYNDLEGLSFNDTYINEINIANISKSKRASIQIKLIEIGLNYIYNSIQEKINGNKNNLKIMEDTIHLIDLYHKRINGNKNRIEQENKRRELMKKVEEKNKKIYFLPRGQFEKYNIVKMKNMKDKDRLKNKKVIKKIDIWDFLHDQNIEDKLLNENI